MNLRTEALDCLYVNWVVPARSAPCLPEPLRYETHDWLGEPWVFTTALFFRFSGLRSRLLPMIRLSYPQMSLRLYVIDGEGVPSVLFARMLVPLWVAPVARVIGRQPATSGRFDYPQSSGTLPVEEATWQLQRDGGELAVRCRPGVPRCCSGPPDFDWHRTVESIRRRQRGYVLTGGGMRALQRQQPSLDVVPMIAEVGRADLLDRTFSGVDPEHWSQPHSAWLCPQIPVVFELGELHLLPLTGSRQMATVPDGC